MFFCKSPSEECFVDDEAAVQGASVETIRSWLSVEERTEQITKFHGFSSIVSPGTELPLRWLSDLTTKFLQSSDSMLFITGEAGCGKSTFVKSIVDRSKARYSRGAKVLFFSIGMLKVSFLIES